jgi:hypothetical protein
MSDPYSHPPVYETEDVDEMAAGQLAVLAEARRRLQDHIDSRTLQDEVCAVLDAYAAEIADPDRD